MDEIVTKQQLSDSLKLMAVCFYEPEPALFEEEKVFQNLSNLFEGFCPAACISTENMHRAIYSSSQEELQIAHADLFIGPFELKASPYGSTYLEEKGMVMGDSTMEVLKHYRKAGLEIDIKQPPDHIAIELEFLSYLCALEVEALRDGDVGKAAELQAEQKLFLGKFILPWMPDFIKNIRAGTENTFYRCLADCFETFLQQLELQNNPADMYVLDGMKTDADATTH